MLWAEMNQNIILNNWLTVVLLNYFQFNAFWLYTLVEHFWSGIKGKFDEEGKHISSESISLSIWKHEIWYTRRGLSRQLEHRQSSFYQKKGQSLSSSIDGLIGWFDAYRNSLLIPFSFQEIRGNTSCLKWGGEATARLKREGVK